MGYAATPSRLSVLLVSDVVGSTELKTRLGLAEYARRLARHDEIFKQLVARFPNAEILKDTGDGFFTSFATTSDAVRCALSFQHALHDEEWSEPRLTTRIGIHVGEVAEMELEHTGKRKIVGLAADLVSRIANLAVPGQILLTRFAFNEARHFVSSDSATFRNGKANHELKWIAHGPYLLKGSDEPIEIFEVGAINIAPLRTPPENEDTRRVVPAGEDDTLGWRPAVGLEVPDRPQWELERRLGEGGFGEVWLARQKKLGTHRAFKFCFDPGHLRSLKRELTLFRLLSDSLGDRQDIARIYEVKLDSPPYFLESEYTEGGSLQDWSDMEGGIATIPLVTRLDLMARVADAVAAAHSVGVLHKDIKPSNVLIALHDGKPMPRLADFGIGVVLDRSRLPPQPITLNLTLTNSPSSSLTGTRLYIPPEVLAGAPFTVQGDIYALGVLLYQMIVADLNRPLAEGWQRDVSDELLREDIMCCVDGDPTRRFHSAADLAKRLRSLPQRHEWIDQQRRAEISMARRRQITRLSVGIAAALFILLSLVGTLAWRERTLRDVAERARIEEAHARVEADDQRKIADAVGSFLMDLLLSVSPDTREGRNVTVLQALGVAAEKLEQQALHPEVEAYVRNTLSASYRSLGEVQLAEPHARKAVALIEKLKGENDPDTHNFRGELGMILVELGKPEEAEPILDAAVEGMRRTLGAEHESTLSHIGDYALTLLHLNREAEAEPIIESLLEVRTRQHGPDSEKTLTVMNTHAGLLYQQGRYTEAAEKFGHIYQSRRRTSGEDHPTTLAAAQNYASLLFRVGRTQEATDMMERFVAAQERVVGPEHPRTLDAMMNLSQMKRSLGNDGEAIHLLKRVHEIRTRKLGAEHPDALHTAAMLGAALAETNRSSEAEPLLRQTLELQKKVLPANDPAIFNSMSALAAAWEHQGRFDDASAMYRDVLEQQSAVFGEQHPHNIKNGYYLARCLVKMNRIDEAEPLLKSALALARNPVSPNRRMEGYILEQLAVLCEVSGKMEQAAEYRAMLPATFPATAPSRQPPTQPTTEPALTGVGGE